MSQISRIPQIALDVADDIRRDNEPISAEELFARAPLEPISAEELFRRGVPSTEDTLREMRGLGPRRPDEEYKNPPVGKLSDLIGVNRPVPDLVQKFDKLDEKDVSQAYKNTAFPPPPPEFIDRYRRATDSIKESTALLQKIEAEKKEDEWFSMPIEDRIAKRIAAKEDFDGRKLTATEKAVISNVETGRVPTRPEDRVSKKTAGEQLLHDLGRPIEAAKKIPFAGSLFGILDALNASNSAKRIQSGNYDLLDLETFADFQERLAFESRRGGFGSNTVSIIANWAPFAVEFAVSGGLVSGAKKGVEKAAEKAGEGAVKAGYREGLKALVKETPAAARRVLSESAGRLPAFAPRIAEKATYNATIADQDVGTAIVTSIVDMGIEVFSELTGPGITRVIDDVIPGMKNFKREMISMASRKLGLNPDEATKWLARVGYNGWVEEFGEERVGNAARSIVFGRPYEEDPQEMLAEVAAFATIGAGSALGTRPGARREASRRMAQAARDFVNNDPDAANEWLKSVDPEKGPSRSQAPGYARAADRKAYGKSVAAALIIENIKPKPLRGTTGPGPTVEQDYPESRPLAGEYPLAGQTPPLQGREPARTLVTPPPVPEGMESPPAEAQKPPAATETPPEAPVEAPPADTQPPGYYGTVDNPDVARLGEHYWQELSGGRTYATIVDARKSAEKLLGGKVAPGTTAAKLVDEAVEAGVVRLARQYASGGNGRNDDPHRTFTRLLGFYNHRQPNLGVRSSTSMQNQAYSTPAPLAYVMNQLAKVGQYTTVYEPTAGNGMLLIGTSQDRATVNEIDDTRTSVLKSQGFRPTQHDATEWVPDRKVDVILANPPFGKHLGTVWPMRRGETKLIDHAITLKALEALKDNGRAVILIGGPSRQTLNSQDPEALKNFYSGQDRGGFYINLYDDYNVVGHFTLAGEMYSKQGASYPTDLIVIEGKGQSQREYPQYAQPTLVESYEQLEELLDDDSFAKLAGPRRSVQPGGKRASAGGQGTAGGGADTGEVHPKPSGPRGTDDGGSDAGSRPGGDRGSDSGDVAGPERRPRPDVERPGDTGVRPSPPPTGPTAPESGAGGSEQSGRGEPGRGPSDQGNRPGDVGTGSKAGGERIGGVEGARNKKIRDLDAEKKKAIEEKAAKIRKLLEDRKKDSTDRGEVSGMPAQDPELIRLGVELAQDFIDAGVIPFNDFAIAMVDVIGEDIIPELKSIYLSLSANVSDEVFDQMTTQGELRKLTDEDIRNIAAPPAIEEETDEEEVQPPEEPPVEEEKPVEPEGPAEPEVREEDEPLILTDRESGGQTKYTPRSKAPSVDTLIPSNLVDAMEFALDNFEAEFGDIDKFVADQLGRKIDDLKTRYSGEQVEAIGFAIAAAKRNGALILGDQTGVGKGRPNAAMQEWAIRQNYIPVWITEKPTLYADMVRDLIAIGASDAERPFRILQTNKFGGSAIIDLPDGRQLKGYNAHNDVLAEAAEGAEKTGKLNAVVDGKRTEWDALWSTYDQINAYKGLPTPRHAPVAAVVRLGFLIMDETHNAGGSNLDKPQSKKSKKPKLPRAIMFRQFVQQAQGVMYSSATFAKRPEVMDLFLRTTLRHAFASRAEIKSAMDRGGIPLQQLVTEMLTRDGQYLRREKSYEGINFNSEIVPALRTVSEQLSYQFSQIHQIYELIRPLIEAIQAAYNKGAKQTGAFNVGTLAFGSVLHNGVAQMLLAAKANAAADRAIKAIEAGEKPIIALTHTMESHVDDEIDRTEVKIGDPFDATFTSVMLRALRKSRKYSVADPFGNKTENEISDEELAEAGLLEIYRATYKQIEEDKELSKLPLSAIDWIQYRLRKAGYNVAELTGRNVKVDYREDGTGVVSTRASEEKSNKAKQRIIAAYNGGAVGDKSIPKSEWIDCLIVNKSAAAGISLHPSHETGKDHRPRNMIILQADPDVAGFMQILGRINRTGQLEKPIYTLLMSDIPAEARPAAVLMKKLASLNANTIAGRKGKVAFDVPDFLNEIGDEVVAEMMFEDQDLHNRIGKPLGDPTTNGFGSNEAARRVTGALVMAEVADQEAFYADLLGRYNDRVKQLDAMGANPLVAKTYNLKAETLTRYVIVDGAHNPDSEFLKPAYIELVNMRKIGRPFTGEEVQKQVDGARPKLAKLIDRIIKGYESRPNRLVDANGRPLGRKTLKRLGKKIKKGFRRKFPPVELKAGITDPKLSVDELMTLLIQTVQSKVQAYVDESLAEYEKRLRSRHDLTEEDIRDKLRARELGMMEPFYDLRPFLRNYGVGQQVRLESGKTGEVYVGVVTKIDSRGRLKNPAARSMWKMTVAVADAAQELTFSLQDTIPVGGAKAVMAIERINNADIYDEFRVDDIYEAFNISRRATREDRFMLTGNIPAGMATDSEMKGSLLMFTRADGTIHPGMLLPKDFDVDGFIQDLPVQLQTPAAALQFLDRANVDLRTHDELMTVKRHGNMYRFQVPQARATGSLYSLNPKILEAMKEEAPQGFVGVNRFFRAEVSRTTAEKVIEAMYSQRMQLYAFAAKDVAGGLNDRPGPREDLPSGGGGPASTIEENEGDENAKAGTPSNRPRAWTYESDPAVKRITAHEIAKLASVVADAPIRVGKGHFQQRNGVLGWYWRVQHNIRIRFGNDLQTIVHEMGHALHMRLLDYKLNFPVDVRNELIQLGHILYGSRKPAGGYAREGFAELIAMWMLDGRPEVDSPVSWDWLNDRVLPKYPEIRDQLNKLRRMFDRWDRQGAMGRVAGTITTNRNEPTEPREAPAIKLQRETANLAWNDKAGINSIGQMAEAAGTLKRGMDPHKWAHVFTHSASAMARDAIENGVFSVMTNQRIGPSMTDVFKLLGKMSEEKLNEFTWFLVAQHAIELHRTGRRLPVDVRDYIWVWRQLKDRPGFKEAAQKFTEFHNALVNMLAEVGRISSHERWLILNTFTSYVPFLRAMGVMASSIKEGGGRGFADAKNPIKRMSKTGSGRSILDPVAVTQQMAVQFYLAAGQTLVSRMVIDTANTVPGQGWLVEGPIEQSTQKVKTTVAKIKKQLENLGLDLSHLTEDDLNTTISIVQATQFYKGRDPIITIFRNGKAEQYQLHPDLYDSIRGLSIWDLPVYLRPLQWATRLKRSGATTFRPSFGTLINPLRDTWTYLIRTDQPDIKSFWNLMMAAVHQGMEVFSAARGKGHDPVLQIYRQWGGQLSGFVGQDLDKALKDVRKVQRKAVNSGIMGTGTRVRDIVNPINWVGFVRETLAFAETTPRFAEFEARLAKWGYTRKRIEAGEIPHARAVVDALYSSMIVTTNFRQAGHIGRIINKINAYKNAKIQDIVTDVNLIRSNPIRTFLRGVTYLTIPQLLYWYMVKDDDWYKELPWWRKFGFFNINISQDKKKPFVLSLPSPFGLGMLFGKLPVVLAEALFHENPKAVNAWLEQLLKEYGATNTTDALQWVLPDAVLPLVELSAGPGGFSYFRERSIEPDYMNEGLLPKDRFNEWTTEAAKQLGVLLSRIPGPTKDKGISPMKLDYAINGYFPLGTDLLRMFEGDYSSVLGYGRLTRGISRGKSIEEFYKQLQDMKESHGSARKHGEESREFELNYKRMTDIADLISDVRALQREAGSDEAEDEYNYWITGLARVGLGIEEPSETYPSLFSADEIPADLKKIRDHYREMRRKDANSSRPTWKKLEKRSKFNERMDDWRFKREHANEMLNLFRKK